MEETRIEIKDKLLNKDGSLKFKFGSQSTQYIQKYLTPDEINFLSNLFGRNLSEKIYCLANDIEEQPKCVCGKPLYFIAYGQGYRKYCSNTCTLKNREISEESNIKRNETFKANHNGQTFGEFSQTQSVQQKRKQTNMEKYGNEYAIASDEVRQNMKPVNYKAIGQKVSASIPKRTTPFNNAKYDFHSMKFDSSWELAFWIYNTDMGFPIKRNTKSFDYIENGKKRKYFPDFIVGEQLIEIKGDHFKSGDLYEKHWKLKEEICKRENIKVLYSSELSPMFDYVYKKYGKNYLKQFQIKKDSKRKIIEIKQGDDIFQYRNSNIKLKFKCENCKKEVITSYSTVSRLKEFKCKNCRKHISTN